MVDENCRVYPTIFLCSQAQKWQFSLVAAEAELIPTLRPQQEKIVYWPRPQKKNFLRSHVIDGRNKLFLKIVDN